jgi:hypothetical protein
MPSPSSFLPSACDSDGAVIIDFDRDIRSTLNATGAYIWQQLERGKSVVQIISELATETGADETLVSDDVSEFVEQLRSNGLLARP